MPLPRLLPSCLPVEGALIKTPWPLTVAVSFLGFRPSLPSRGSGNISSTKIERRWWGPLWGGVVVVVAVFWTLVAAFNSPGNRRRSSLSQQLCGPGTTAPVEHLGF